MLSCLPPRLAFRHCTGNERNHAQKSFGHPDSTLLLCPYGNNINYINHNRQEANLKIRWATNFPSGHNQTAVEKGPFDMFSKTEQPFLAFDYVATKNIAKDTELFLDYGDAWVAGMFLFY